MSIHISTYMPTSTSTYTWASYNATTIVSSSDMSSSLLSILAFLTWTVLGVRALWQRCRVIFHTPSHPGYITSFLKYLEQLHECSVCEWFLQALLSENSYCGELRKSSTKVIIHLTFTSTLALTLFLVTRHSHLFPASELDIPFCSCITHKVLRTSTCLQWIMGSQSWTLNLLSLLFLCDCTVECKGLTCIPAEYIDHVGQWERSIY
jgi:hypothetical protein